MQRDALKEKVSQHLMFIYADVAISVGDIAEQLLQAMGLETDDDIQQAPAHHNYWDETNVMLITYGDSVMDAHERPLFTLYHFLHTYCRHSINMVHLLPFYPYSSDDGFSVMDYSQVNPSLGEWDDVARIAAEVDVMFDVVMNHCSARSLWFENFLRGEGPGHDFFFTADMTDDLSSVVRPRTSPLLRECQTATGTQYVWCTFSHDQIDFDFRNPRVLVEFVRILADYIDKGARVFRLDAVAFLWKMVGTTCINLPQTHEIIRLLRTLLECRDPRLLMITETNIPNHENIAYFGNANEAHAIYNFSLPPLLLYALITGDSQPLKRWMMSMPPAQHGTFYFNFIASHDGIGLRPAEGLLSDAQRDVLVQTLQEFGAKVSARATETGVAKPYEINIALFDACAGTSAGADAWQIERFLCAHAIMFSMEGIPGIYIHSLLGTRNDYDKVLNTGQNRSINRHRWQYSELQQQLDDVTSSHHQVFTRMTQLLLVRKQQRAFHPNATQYTLHLESPFFGFWRQSQDRRQSIFCVSNISDSDNALLLTSLNLIDSEQWRDLITGEPLPVLSGFIQFRPYQSMWISNGRS